MKKCTCGCENFMGHIVMHSAVLVNGEKKVLNVDECIDNTLPFGPFTCDECGKTYKDWDSVPDMPSTRERWKTDFPKPEYFDIVFLEKPLDGGLTMDDMAWLMSTLSQSEFIPLEVQSDCSAAIGLIALETAEEMGYDYTNLSNAVEEILEDMKKENSSCIYQMKNESRTDGEEKTYKFVLTRNHLDFVV